jgi:hypothetical protein
MHWGMINTKAVFIGSIVNSDHDRHRCIYQTDDSGGYTNEIGVTSIRCACEPWTKSSVISNEIQHTTYKETMGECLDAISGV